MACVLVHYDSEADATTVELGSGEVSRTVEIVDGHLLVDVDSEGRPISVEILCAPADVGEPVYAALVERFPDLDLGTLRSVIAGRSPTTSSR